MLARHRPLRDYLTASAVAAIFFLVLFSPVLGKGLILGPGDGVQYWVFLKRGFLLWNERILAGFPAFADPQQILWYPLRWLAPTFNLFVVSAYVLAAVSAYIMAREYRAGRAAAAAAALVYAASGFMMAHLGHTTIVHAAAWLPLIIASIEKQARLGSGLWRAAGAVAIGCAFLAGHPQVVVYGLGLGVLLMGVNIALRAREDRRAALRLALGYAAMACAGVLLAAVQLIPTAELAGATARADMGFREFITYSLPPSQAILTLFPFAFGPWFEGGPPYFGQWNFTELANYVGLSTLTLIAAAFLQIGHPKKYFWLAAGLLAFLFSFGGATPVADLAFELPVVNSFRVPARAAIIVALAAAVLVAMSIETVRTDARRVRAALLGAVVPAVAVAAALVWRARVDAVAAAASVDAPTLLSQTYLVPVAAALAVLAAIVLLRRPQWLAAGALAIVALDVTWYAVNVEWRFASSPTPVLSESVARLRDRSNAVVGRVAPLDGVLKGPVALLPNISSVFGVQSSSGYGPLLPKVYGDLAGISPSGEAMPGSVHALSLQAMGVSHLAFSGSASGELVFARGCGEAPPPQRIVIPTPAGTRASHLRISSNMGCSPQIEQGAPVLSIQAYRGAQPVGAPAFARAGVHTAEWAIRRPDIAPIVRHVQPPRSYDLPGTNGIGRIFNADIALTDRGDAIELDGVALDFVVDAGAMRVFALELVDAATGDTVALETSLVSRMGADKVVIEEPLDGGAVSARFAGFLGRAWLVPEAAYVSHAASLRAIKTGTLVDGAPLDLSQTVLIDHPEPPASSAAAKSGSVTWISRGDGFAELKVDSGAPQFLVIAQQFYPGWRATVDGVPVGIYRANHAFQAVHVPAGESTVRLSFMPRTLLIGGALSLVALLLVAVLALGASGMNWFPRRA